MAACRALVCLSILAFCLAGPAGAQFEMGSAFTHQGSLRESGRPANGTYDFVFRLYDAPSGGSMLGSEVTHDNVEAASGLYSVALDFGEDAFTGGKRYLEVLVRAGDSLGSFTALTPRLELTPQPYALHAAAAASINSETIQTGITSGGAGGLIFLGGNGNMNVLLDSTEGHGFTGSANDGSVTLGNSDGARRAEMMLLSGGEGYLGLYGPNGSMNALITSRYGDRDHGYLGVTDSSGYGTVAMMTMEGEFGYVATYGSNGETNVSVTAHGSSDNHGYVSVDDAGGNPEAGMYVDSFGNGVLFSDLKSTIVPHPTNEKQLIVYSSTESPEPAIQCRGVASLEQGFAAIDLPDHFAAMAVPGSVTVHLTPASSDSQGLAIESISEDRIDIRELGAGTGTYNVHYLVMARRRGFEKYQPLVDKDAAGALGLPTGQDARRQQQGKATLPNTPARSVP